MIDFIEWLMGDSHMGTDLVETRTAYLGMHQSFYQSSRYRDLVSDVMSDDALGRDVYIGVLPRIRSGGTTSDVYPLTNTLWADIDAKHHGDSKPAALAAILDFPVPPSVIVDSGHGYHCYWRTTLHVPFTDAQRIMKGIARVLRGDSVYDAARILRIPGTHNHKDPANVVPVRLIRLDTTLSYPVSDLADFAYVEQVTQHRVLYDSGEPWDVAVDLDYDPGKGYRSGHDFGVVCWMVEHGWDDSEIAEAFLSHPNGIGAKVASKGTGGFRYLERTIDKARSVAR